MKRKSLYTVSVLSLIFLISCEHMGESDSDSDTYTPQAFEKLYNEASQAASAANEVGNLWRDTEELLKKAKHASETKDMVKAVKMVKDALQQARLAKEQFEEQQTAGPYLF